MDLIVQITIVIEIIITNMIVFSKNAKPKYPFYKTLFVIVLYTIALIVFGYLFLSQFNIYGNGNGLFTMLGFLYLPIIHYLFDIKYRDEFFIICFAWIYTLVVFSISVQIGYLLSDFGRFTMTLIAQTLIFACTYKYMFQFTENVYVKLLDCQQRKISKYIDRVTFIWFLTIFFINLNFILENVYILKIIAFIVILTNVIVSYLLLYEILSKNNHIGILQNQIAKDTLTEVGSRIGFENFVCQKIKNNDEFALIYLDLDNFKEINDTFGHLLGDQYLKVFARELANHENIDVFRISGDEFIVICSILNYLNLLNKFNHIHFKLNNEIIFKGVSTGYALYPSEAKNIDQLIYLADQRMYRFKYQNKK